MDILQDGKSIVVIFTLMSVIRSSHLQRLLFCRETLYQSYPLSETKKGTWDPIEELNLGVLVQAGEDLCFRITVRDCDTKSGNHRLIGVAEVRESELKETSTISIEREGKVKGLLRFDRFEVDWSA